MAYLKQTTGAMLPENTAIHSVEFQISANITGATGFYPAGTPLKSASSVAGQTIASQVNPTASLISADTDVVDGLLAHDLELVTGQPATCGVIIEGVYYSSAKPFEDLTVAQKTAMRAIGLIDYGVKIPVKY